MAESRLKVGQWVMARFGSRWSQVARVESIEIGSIQVRKYRRAVDSFGPQGVVARQDIRPLVAGEHHDDLVKLAKARLERERTEAKAPGYTKERT
jgi:hypothetical protein